MKNLFCQTVDFLSGKVIEEESYAQKIDTVSSEFLSRAAKIDDEIYKLNKRKMILSLISLFVHLLTFILVNIPIMAYMVEKRGENIAITVFLILCFIEFISGVLFHIYIQKFYRQQDLIQFKAQLNDVKTKISVSLNVPVLGSNRFGFKGKIDCNSASKSLTDFLIACTFFPCLPTYFLL